MDIKKAYDSVDRTISYEMLERKGNVLNYLKNFLGKRSDEISFERGIPQGSSLSPLLLNIYMSGISKIENQNISKFADDKRYETGGKTDEEANKLNKKIREVEKWVKNLEPTFSTEKRNIQIKKKYND